MGSYCSLIHINPTYGSSIEVGINGKNPKGTPTALVPSKQGKNWSKKIKTKDKKMDKNKKEPTVLIPSRDGRKLVVGQN